MEELNALWLPFTPNNYFKSHPKLLTESSGIYFKDSNGNKVLDSSAGLWCVNAGHNQPHITNAIKNAAETLDYAPSFQVSHPLTFKLAKRLTDLAPNPLKHAFFTNSGSEAVDSALKIAMHYQAIASNGEKKLIVGREKSYHGVGFGGISVGGLPNNKRHFQQLPHVAHLPHTLDMNKNAYSRGLPAHGKELAESLFDIQKEKGPIGAVIVEPIVGSAGVFPPPVGYLKRLREICDEIGALLIFDEVITAFGRVGQPFASSHFEVTPDIITCAKGLTNGTVPMGAVLVNDEIYNTIVGQSDAPSIEFFHGYTYSGHPLAASAALATLDVYEEQDLYLAADILGPVLEAAVHELSDLDLVMDIRNYGMMAAIELKPKEGAPGARAFEVFNRCFDKGLLIRITADTIALSPPLTISEDEIQQVVDGIKEEILKLN